MIDNYRVPKITLLGSNSGRNAGDAMILGAIMKALCESAGRAVQFEVPTTHPRFVEKEYGEHFDVKPINVMPWTGSIRLLGIPTFRSIKRTDVTMITDGIIFDINLWNPLFNYLITLIFLIPWAKLCGKKVVCYNVGIGPLNSFFGRMFARWVGNLSDLVMVRDEDSAALFRKIGIKKTIFLTADSVFQGWAADDSKVEKIISKDPVVYKAFSEDRVLGVNITKYIDRWLTKDKKVDSSQSFLETFATALARLKLEQNIEPVFVLTQVMDFEMGEKLANLATEKLKELEQGKALKSPSWSPLIVSNKDHSAHVILGLLKRCRLFTGMRLHSLIIACRAGAPVVGLVYAPKVRSFLSQLETPEYSLELNEITEDILFDKLLSAWQESPSLKERQQEIQSELADSAKEAADMVRDSFFPGEREDRMEEDFSRQRKVSFG